MDNKRSCNTIAMKIRRVSGRRRHQHQRCTLVPVAGVASASAVYVGACGRRGVSGVRGRLWPASASASAVYVSACGRRGVSVSVSGVRGRLWPAWRQHQRCTWAPVAGVGVGVSDVRGRLWPASASASAVYVGACTRRGGGGVRERLWPAWRRRRCVLTRSSSKVNRWSQHCWLQTFQPVWPTCWLSRLSTAITSPGDSRRQPSAHRAPTTLTSTHTLIHLYTVATRPIN